MELIGQRHDMTRQANRIQIVTICKAGANFARFAVGAGLAGWELGREAEAKVGAIGRAENDVIVQDTDALAWGFAMGS